MGPIVKEEFHTNYKKFINFISTLMRKVSRLIMTNILKEIGIILRTTGKESNHLFF